MTRDPADRDAAALPRTGTPEERYPPIENYGVIGDLRTVALVGMNGSIDFFCFPEFDSATIFAALLDADKGGRFSIAPNLREARHKQLYLPDTNVLLTRFLSADGVAEITDFMPVASQGPTGRLIRVVKAVRGSIEFALHCEPRFNYGRETAVLDLRMGRVTFEHPGQEGFALRLFGDAEFHCDEGIARAAFTLAAGDEAVFVLEDARPGHEPLTRAQAQAALAETAQYWRDWTARSTYRGRWRDMVNRSALALKLMSSHARGALVAAPTFGLPEEIGGERNWDYRFTWIRDASFTVFAFMRLGYGDEAVAFMEWLRRRAYAHHTDGSLDIMYPIQPDTSLEEVTLDHLEGYRGSRPVRIGNGASGQLQLDIYGEMMDALYLANKYGPQISYDGWKDVIQSVNYLTGRWREPDEGVWEVRGGRRQLLHSRLMCWVAVDRALRLASALSLPAPFADWTSMRTEIHESIYEDFWNPDLQAFVQYKGGATLDSSVLLMPMMKFISPTDPRWLSTLAKVSAFLVDDALVYRYVRTEGFDGLRGTEGSFTPCSFWYVEALARCGRREEARLIFEKILGYANHLGLYSEELGPSGEHLGNFPQAWTHLSLVSAAMTLDRALDGGQSEWLGWQVGR